MDLDQLVVWSQLAAVILTAFATLALVWVTRVLATETKRLADVGRQPHVIATLEPSPWSIIHTDLIVQNAGSGTAYGIRVEFDPPLQLEKDSAAIEAPLKSISILKPGQALRSFLFGFEGLNERVQRPGELAA